ncbi:hypothetical protein [Roseovarius sp. MMSF_3281]|uniref:hypothetical protein n=1 Tax=Roseovarius sp. MMSF_3281 TaxID=3046694 RepID=UPI00273D7899|nr:hypothetical protein [Roseovarius sp. MMSF_3281]
MIPRNANVEALIQSGQVVVRDFLWFVPRDREAGAPAPVGLWSDVGQVTAQIIDPITDTAQSRSFSGGGVVGVGDVSRASGLTVQSVKIQLGQLDPKGEEIVRTRDLRFARVEIFRGWFDPVGHTLVAPAVARFTGFVDKATIRTPKAGEAGGIDLNCKSFTQELTRKSPERRSDASQRRRDPNDAFFKDVAVVGGWKVWWGQAPE